MIKLIVFATFCASLYFYWPAYVTVLGFLYALIIV